MLDLRTLWLTYPEDRYQPSPGLRRAERAVYPLLRALLVAGEGRVVPREEVQVH